MKKMYLVIILLALCLLCQTSYASIAEDVYYLKPKHVMENALDKGTHISIIMNEMFDQGVDADVLVYNAIELGFSPEETIKIALSYGEDPVEVIVGALNTTIDDSHIVKLLSDNNFNNPKKIIFEAKTRLYIKTLNH